jgi:hypothetical protein
MARRVQNDDNPMPEDTPPNVKIYDRPERKGPTPVVLALIVLVAAALSFFLYRTLRPAPAPATAPVQSGSTTPAFPQLPESVPAAGISVRISPVQG